MSNFGKESICALPFVGSVNDRLGRRAGMFTGATIIIIGAIVIAKSLTTGMFLGGRFILGFGVAFCNISAPVYVGEIAHPYWRGTLMGIYSSLAFVLSSHSRHKLWLLFRALTSELGVSVLSWLLGSCMLLSS